MTLYYDDGVTPVRPSCDIKALFSDKTKTVKSITETKCGHTVEMTDGSKSFYPTGMRVQRPAVVGGDGKVLKIGDVVIGRAANESKPSKYVVEEFVPVHGTVKCLLLGSECIYCNFKPCNLTHDDSVYASDGKPIVPGQVVWGQDGKRWVVRKLIDNERYPVVAEEDTGVTNGELRVRELRPDWLTHKEPDSWEKLMRDVAELCGSMTIRQSEETQALFCRAKVLAAAK